MMNVNDFKYYIACRNSSTKEMEIVATFRHEADRDYSLDALSDAFPDAEWKAEGEE